VEGVELIRLRPGERQVVTLPGMGAAGYRWSFEIIGDAGVVDVARSPVSDADGPSGGELPAGASVPESFALEGRTPGRATVRFSQTRPWEAGAAPLDRQVVDVEVVEEPHGRGPRRA
jgi:predicted secreted protein